MSSVGLYLRKVITVNDSHCGWLFRASTFGGWTGCCVAWHLMMTGRVERRRRRVGLMTWWRGLNFERRLRCGWGEMECKLKLKLRCEKWEMKLRMRLKSSMRDLMKELKIEIRDRWVVGWVASWRFDKLKDEIVECERRMNVVMSDRVWLRRM